MNSNIDTELRELAPGFPLDATDAPFRTPEGYFAQFSDRLMQKINSQVTDNESLSPILAELRDKNPFEVPEGYFNQFRPSINRGNVVSMASTGRLKTMLKYAAAACLMGIIITFVSQNLKPADQEEVAIAEAMEPSVSISEGAFTEYLEEWNLTADEEDTDIEKTGNWLVDINELTINQLLSEMPEKEIKYYITYAGIEEQPALNL